MPPEIATPAPPKGGLAPEDHLGRVVSRSLRTEVRIAQRAADAPADEFIRLEFPVTSETPCERYFGFEVLSHQSGDVKLGRAKQGVAVLLSDKAWFDHYGTRIGITEDAWLDAARVWVRARFARDQFSKDAVQKIQDGVLVDVSAGYIPEEMKLLEERKDGPSTYLVAPWELCEVTFVNGVPADPTVGYGRALDERHPYPLPIPGRSATLQEEPTMPPEAPGATRTVEPATPATAPATTTTAGPATRSLEPREINQIIEMCEFERVPTEQRTQFIENRMSPEQVAFELFASRRTRLGNLQPAAEQLGLSEREQRQFSIRRSIELLLRRKHTGQGFDGLEGEVHKDLRSKAPEGYVERGGIVVPIMLGRGVGYSKRTSGAVVGTGLANAGAELVETYRQETIDVIRPRAVLQMLGARVLPDVTGQLIWPKVSADPVVRWMRENPAAGSAATKTSLKWITSGPKTLIGNYPIPRQLIHATSFDVEADVERRFVIGTNQAIDRGGWHGSGTANEPAGLFSLADVQTVTMGGIPTNTKVQAMFGKVPDGTAGGLSLATTRLMASELASTLKVSNGTRFIWEGSLEDGIVCGYRGVSTDQISKVLGSGSDHGIMAGPFGAVVIPMWGAVEIVIDETTYADEGAIRVVSFGMADVICEYPEAFVKALTAVITSL